MFRKDLIILIPAREGGQLIKNKNLISINNKPLILYTINIAKRFCNRQSLIFCSTNSKKIKSICEKNKLTIPILRPNKISRKLSRDIEFVNHAIKYFFENGYKFRNGLILRPTSPVRNLKVIKKAYKYFRQSDFQSMRAIVKLGIPCFKMWFMDKDKRIHSAVKSNIIEHYNAPRQIIPNTYYQTGNFEFFRNNYKSKIK